MLGVNPGSTPARLMQAEQAQDYYRTEEGPKMEMMRPVTGNPLMGQTAPGNGLPSQGAPGNPLLNQTPVAQNQGMLNQLPTAPVTAPRDCARVIVYGKAGCPACIEAVQDLIDRQVCFTYHDVSRDEKAMVQLQAICGTDALVPVIIQVGVRGG